MQLSGGEPLLYRALHELIGRLRAAGLRVSLLTDGALLDEAGARALARLGVHTIEPTLLSGAPELHDALRGSGAFQGATHAIAAAAAAGLPVSVSYVITARNADPAVATSVAELAFALGARTLALSRFCPTGPTAARAGDLLPTPSQARQAIHAAASACHRLGLSGAAAIPIPACVFEDPLRPPLPTGACALLAERTVVTLGPIDPCVPAHCPRAPWGTCATSPGPPSAHGCFKGSSSPFARPCPSPARTAPCGSAAAVAAASPASPPRAPETAWTPWPRQGATQQTERSEPGPFAPSASAL